MTKAFKIFLITIGAFILIIIILGIFTLEENESEQKAIKSKPEPPKPQPKPESMEYMLATIDKGYVSSDDIIIARFRSLLQQLDSTYVESKEQIGDMTVGTQKLLKDEGVKETLLNIMEGMNSLFSKRIENQKYAEYASAYAVLRTKGQSHHEAIAGLRAILQSLGIY